MKKKPKRKILIIAGARPNFMKIGPLMREISQYPDIFIQILVHTGQHYDDEMSKIFFQDLRLPKPDIYLGVGSGTHAVQTAKIMLAFEEVCFQEKPDLVIVVGDVNSTAACSLVAAKLGIQVAHVEAGLRSFDRSMPEEINRVITDSLSDYLFVSEKSGTENLKKEGIDSRKVHFVGNIMIDSLKTNLTRINEASILQKLNLYTGDYCVLTLHRPKNVDSSRSLAEIYTILKSTAEHIKIIYPIHPRTRKMIETHLFLEKFSNLKNLIMLDPLGYIEFLKLIKESRLVLTDSGGIQEETTFLNIPCLTMRENTERPVTIQEGTNILVGRNGEKISWNLKNILQGKKKKSTIPKYWDGKTAERILQILINL